MNNLVFTPVIKYVKLLARPRLVGSNGETETLDYLERRLQEMGYEPKRGDFTFSTLPTRFLFDLLPLAVAAAALAAVTCVIYAPVISVALGIAALLALPFASRWSSIAEKIFDLPARKETCNLVTEIPGEGPPLIFSAHHDSKSQTLPIVLRIAAMFLGMPLAALVALAAAVYAAFVLVEVAPARTGAFILAIPAAVASLASLFVLFNFTRNRSPGALDNASGCAVLLALAERFAKTPPPRRIVFLFTGAEEYGMAGAINYARAHEAELPGAVNVNFDAVGCGTRIGIVRRYGLPPVTTSRELAARLVASMPETRPVFVPLGVGFDMFPFVLRGVESVTVTSTEFRALCALHTKRDTLDLLDADTLERCVTLGLAAAESGAGQRV